MKYIHINQFIKLTKKFSNAELITYIVINLIKNHLHIFSVKKLFYFLSFYSKRQIDNSLNMLIKNKYIIHLSNDKYQVIKRFAQLTNIKNNIFCITDEIVKKYKKLTILFYKYKIFELFCNDLLVKQEKIKKIFNISQYEIRQFENCFDMNSKKVSLKIKGYSKWYLGLNDINIDNCNYWYSSLPNQYIFYPNTEKINFKVDYNFIDRVRSFLVFDNYKPDKGDSGINQKKVLKPDKINIKSQLSSIYTKIIEEPRKYSYKIEKQLTELFPYFVKRNHITKYYKYKLCHLFS